MYSGYILSSLRSFFYSALAACSLAGIKLSIRYGHLFRALFFFTNLLYLIGALFAI